MLDPKKPLINPKNLVMQRCDYLLKRGAVLQAFSDTSKVCTNGNITNALAEWHLRNNPACARLFAKIPAGAPITPVSASPIRIIPRPPDIVVPEKIIFPKQEEPEEVKEEVEEEKPEEIKVNIVHKKRKPIRKTKK
jgi:hypothetical protein